ncbi:hypothetical protein FJZ21_01280 [Candidatus Pacearchaeota archaeon]|nr:hypothetical protein [Candidatus Pacearchaeota archaeon]
MNKKASFFLALAITAIITGNYLFFADDGLVREKVEISRVLDGDTVELSDGRKIRLLNINTPEKEVSYSELGKDYLSSFKEVELESDGLDRYQRTLGRLYYQETYINLEIVRRGYAHSYLVSDKEEKLFDDAEEYARKNELNIWDRSEFYDCLKVEINKYDEYLDVEESCKINFKGWSIKDESTKTYSFEEDIGDSFRLYSKKGEDNEKELYWGREKIWNDDHDEVFIRDSAGLLVYYNSYG